MSSRGKIERGMMWQPHYEKLGLLIIVTYFSTIPVVSCDTPDDPINGNHTLSGGAQYQDTVTFDCNIGYTLSGSQTAMCQADGTWSGIPATCSCMYPFVLPLPS